jgi:hypothetical protein
VYRIAEQLEENVKSVWRTKEVKAFAAEGFYREGLG